MNNDQKELQMIANIGERVELLKKDNKRFQDRITQLEAALKKYGKHEKNCRYPDTALMTTYVKDNKVAHEAFDDECTCGLIKALNPEGSERE